MSSSVLKAPFPYFGGKSAVADLVWARLGDPDNYVEPFAGTAATLLRRPKPGKIETINDRNHFVTNFWRSVQHSIDRVVEFADGPVNEADLHSRHTWLMQSEQSIEFQKRMASEPDYFDSQIAGWWVWGQCCWIGGGWCDDLGTHSKRPLLDHGESRGVVGLGRPQLGDAFDIGRGVNSNQHAGTCEQRRAWLHDWIESLSDRLRLVRVCYGHWNRICDSKTTMDRLGLTGAFLDPPYAKSIERVQALIRGEDAAAGKASNRANELYAGDKTQDIDALVAEVNQWCQRWGKHSKVRIALCGYEGEHDNLVANHEWTVESWKPNGGYANRNAENQNKHRERIWFSPGCIDPTDGGFLF